MDVLLVNPRSNVCVDPPLGLMYISSYLESIGVSTKILDLSIERYETDRIQEIVSDYSPEYIGITATTPRILDAYRLARVFKSTTNAKILIGGPHVSFTPEQTLTECKEIDMVIRGEGELTMAELLKNGPEGVEGVSFRRGNKIIHNKDREQIQDLDLLPFPAWNKVDHKKYYFMRPGMDVAMVPMITSRGCPFDCIFCSSSEFWGHKVRGRSPTNVLREIEYIRSLGYSGVHFHDDFFTYDKKRVYDICRLIKENMDITWSCETRVDSVDYELMGEMAKAGCGLIEFGVESASNKILETAKKKITREESASKIRIAKGLGIKTLVYMIFGLPGETEKTIEDSILFIEDVKPDFLMVSLASIYPGTQLCKLAMEKGIVQDEFWIKELKQNKIDNYIGHGINIPVYIPEDITKEKMYKYVIYCLKNLYRGWPFYDYMCKDLKW